MKQTDDLRMDALLQSAARAHNAALPLADWKAELLASAGASGAGAAEDILAFARPGKKPLYRRALPYACAAAAVVVLIAGLSSMGSHAPAPAQAPALFSADSAAAEAAPADAPMAAAAGEAAQSAMTVEQPAPVEQPESAQDAGVAEAAAAPEADAPAAGADGPGGRIAMNGSGASGAGYPVAEEYWAAYESCLAYGAHNGLVFDASGAVRVAVLTEEELAAVEPLPGMEALLGAGDWAFAFDGAARTLVCDCETGAVIGLIGEE